MPFRRFTRHEMLDLVWSKPMRDVAAEIGVSDVAVKKACRSADVATPPQGHWNKIHAGKAGFVKPTLSPRIFGAADEVTFGAEPWNAWADDVDLGTPVVPPVFDEPMEAVRARAVKAVGRLAVSRDLERFAHDAIRRLMRDEAQRAAWLIDSGSTWSWEIERKGPRFLKPSDARCIRILSAIALGIARGGVRVRDWSGGSLCLRLETDGGPLALRTAMTPEPATKRGEASRSALTVSLSANWESAEGPALISWRDADEMRLETRVAGIAVDCLVACEEHLREQMRASAKRREDWRIWKIEDNEKKRLEAERRERERQAQMERERVERLLGEADALRRAEAIRAYVAEVGRLQADGRSPVDEAAFERWKAWALAQADRIDPVASGAFARGIEDAG